ncbi:MAG: type II secretion system F family protein [Acidimicrobiales bacterium]
MDARAVSRRVRGGRPTNRGRRVVRPRRRSRRRRAGEVTRGLLNALAVAEHDGGAVLPTLLRVGDEARRRRRVEAQERARRLPVTMLLPLVVCVLPAFGLLAVAPLLLAPLRGVMVGF